MSVEAVLIELGRTMTKERQLMADVFISHIREEAKLASALKTFLVATIEPPLRAEAMMMRRRPHIFVSSEPGAIPPGEDWLAHLKQALTSAKVVIPLLTQRSLRRPWVNFETGAAWLANKKIIPAWCEEQVFEGHFPKPYADWQIVHLPEGADDLRIAVERYLGAHPSQPPRIILPDVLSNLQEAFMQFHKTQADRNAAALMEQRRRSRPLPQQAKVDYDVLNYDPDR
jgi:hypothetical protein